MAVIDEVLYGFHILKFQSRAGLVDACVTCRHRTGRDCTLSLARFVTEDFPLPCPLDEAVRAESDKEDVFDDPSF